MRGDILLRFAGRKHYGPHYQSCGILIWKQSHMRIRGKFVHASFLPVAVAKHLKDHYAHSRCCTLILGDQADR